MPVAQTETAVDHKEGQILREIGVLIAVVHHHDVGPRRHREARGLDPVGADPGGRNAGQQNRFVADFAGAVVGIDPQGARGAAAVAAGEDVRVAAMSFEVTRHGEGRGRLAGAAHGDVAQTDDRDRWAYRVGGGAPDAARDPVERAERAE